MSGYSHTHNHGHNHGHNAHGGCTQCAQSSCGCQKTECSCYNPCPTCTTVALPEPCCERCGVKSCNKQCSPCGLEGPEEVTDEEFAHGCAWFWMTIYRNCTQQPVRVSPKRFRAFLTENIDWTEVVDATFINEIVNAAIEQNNSKYVTLLAFQTFANKVTEICATLGTVNQTILGLQQQILALQSQQNGLTKAEVELCIENALADYYNRTQINNLVEGLQNQITTQAATIAQLAADLAACCNQTDPTTAPTGSWGDVLDGSCPAVASSAVVNPDAVQFCLESTGTATVTATVDNVAVPASDLFTGFNVPDGATLVISVEHPTDNVVGVVNVNWLDPDNANAKTFIDGFQYDAQCAEGGGTLDAPNIACPENQELTVNETMTAVSATNSGGTVASWSISPALPAGLSFSDGTLSGTPTTASPETTYTITAGNATGPSTCTFTIAVTNACAGSGTFTGGCVTGIPSAYCGISASSNPAGINNVTGPPGHLGVMGDGTFQALYIAADGTITLETSATNIASITIAGIVSTNTLLLANANQSGSTYTWNGGVDQLNLSDEFTLSWDC